MRKISYTFLLLTFWCSVQGAIILPKSLRLAGPLNSGLSEFGDEFFNFPSFYQGMAPPGGTHLSGWITFDFEPPVEGKADFTMTFLSVGLDDQVQFPGGQIYTLLENRAFTNPAFISRGELDLETGEVENVEIHAIFQNGIIARVTKAIRIPLGFINDYPPTALPIDLPYEQRPSVDREARFLFDAATGRIIGFEFHGETTAPVTLFPLLGIFPPYSFGDNNRFYFSNPTGCVEGAPPENCPSDETNPDGVRLPNEAFFHPHLDLITRELQEVGDLVTPPCQLEGTASPNGLVALDGDLYHLGGIGAGQRVQVYSQETNQWGDAAPVPIGVIAAQSAAAGSKIHLVGGWVEAENRSTSLVQTFDPASDSWTFGSSAPIPVSGGVAVSVNSQVFVIGGWNNDRTGNPVLTADVQIYDPSTDSWTSGTSAPQATAGSSAVAVGNQIYLINGRIAGDRVTDQVWVYDVVANRWTESTPTLHGVYEAAATSTGDRIYLVGGRQEVGGPSVRIMQVYDSNPKDLQSKFWRNGLEPPVPTAAAAAVDGQVFVVGGRVMVGTDSAPGPVRGVVQAYDPKRGWTVCNSKPVFTSATVMNAACGVVAPTDLSPGSRAVILGHNFSDKRAEAGPVQFQDQRYSTDLPRKLNGIQIWVDGKPASILAVDANRVDFQIPFNVLASSRNRRKVSLQLIKEGSAQQAPPVEIPLLSSGPGIFVYNFGELQNPIYLDRATAIARNEDGTINHPSRPAAPGDTVTLEVTGLGVAFPTPESGQRAGAVPPHESGFMPEATVDGIDAQVVSSALSPRRVGVYEVRVVVPADSPKANNVTVPLSVAGVQSNRASISVR